MPSISIILPVYNAERYLSDTLTSILDQSFTDFELICIDDGSTDSSLHILESYSRVDDRIQIITQDNSGPGAARNAGLEVAIGKYTIMLDADDLYDPAMLETLFTKAETINADVVVARSTQFDDETNEIIESWWTINIHQIPNKDVFSPLEMRDFIFTAFIGWPWDKLYRRDFIEEHKIRYPELPNSEDLYFVFLSLAKAHAIGIIETPLIRHRTNRSGSVSGSRSKAPLAFYDSTCQLKAELKKDPDLYQALSWSFLNWAFGYMLWNIETMNDMAARAEQLDALINDKFQELEIPLHSPAFFSLEPSAYQRYIALLEEAAGKNTSTTIVRKNKVLLRRLIRILIILQDEGIRSLASRGVRWIKRKTTKRSVGTTTQNPNLAYRGSDFSLSGRKYLDSETSSSSSK